MTVNPYRALKKTIDFASPKNLKFLMETWLVFKGRTPAPESTQNINLKTLASKNKAPSRHRIGLRSCRTLKRSQRNLVPAPSSKWQNINPTSLGKNGFERRIKFHMINSWRGRYKINGRPSYFSNSLQNPRLNQETHQMVCLEPKTNQISHKTSNQIIIYFPKHMIRMNRSLQYFYSARKANLTSILF